MRYMRLNLILKPALLLAVALAVNAQTPPNVYRIVNLVSNVAGVAAVTDPNLVDPWGFSNPGTPFWISDHVAGLSTVYAATGVAAATVVTIPAASGSGTGKPTGQVQNSGAASFKLSNGGNASFIFCTEDGALAAWNGTAAKLAEIEVNNSAKGAVYKGLAIGTSTAGATLYGANFNSGKIDVWGPGFATVALAGAFTDPSVPAGFAPFNIWNINNSLYVEYAKQDAKQFLDVSGTGNGYVAIFDQNGNLVKHLISNGALNSPWGVAIAPANWGAFGGALLVGNFGDGRINAFNLTTGASLGALQDSTGNPLVIPGLWALMFGTGTKADPNTLYFAAGMPDGTSIARGLLGTVAPPSAVTALVNAASWLPGPLSPGELIVIGGQTIGAVPLTSATIPASGGIATTLGGVTVTVDGTPAPIIYTFASETSVQVPNILFLDSTATVVVNTPGQASQSLTVPVATSAPGLFATNSGGSGQLAAMNSDGTINSATNAAAGGSTVTLYATGEGATNPAGVDGTVQSGASRSPYLKVGLTIGGQAAAVSSAGTPVGFLDGIMVIKAIVPTGLTPGAQPVVLTVGSASTTQTVTISTK